MLFEENNENNWWGGWEDNKPTNQDTPKDWEGEKNKADNNNSIPKYRFDEVNEKYKETKAELQKYKDAEAKKIEEESIKKWEYEKVISQKDQEIADLKKQEEAWKQREEAVSKRNDERIEALKKAFWDDWDTVKNLIADITDPFILQWKLDSLETMKEKHTPWQKWGSWIPWSWWTSRKQELMDKLRNGERLSAKERAELYAETDK